MFLDAVSSLAPMITTISFDTDNNDDTDHYDDNNNNDDNNDPDQTGC